MTREEDIALNDPDAATIREKKRSDLQNRYQLVQEHPNSIFLSVHQNQFSVAKYNGTQVFYSPNHEQSAVLAEYIQQSVVNGLQPSNTRQTKKGGDEYFILYHVQVPAVLIECGFLSNPAEAHQLLDEDYQATFAYLVFRAVADYIDHT